MQAQFWLDKWQKQETGFHLQQVHPLLKKYADKVFADSSSVFIPLCGKTNDIMFFSNQGVNTLGVELSAKAVNDFFKEQKLTVELNARGKFDSYSSEAIEILVGDYFNLSAFDVSSCGHIYDRAALIALPIEMRASYVRKMHELFSQANMLLIALEYDQQVMQGPPFSVEQKEIAQLFNFAQCEKLYSKNIISVEPKFEAKGLNYLNECAYFIRW
ncbi:thiopurine S-methyltransferase [Aliikangiella sp. IMCC44359]|uniref:thiopurine S-methyltransferase n=1 Tax=Aliikangiella sp. IMCC44359 TaxID=3459125 RepID=UPI00403A8856